MGRRGLGRAPNEPSPSGVRRQWPGTGTQSFLGTAGFVPRVSDLCLLRCAGEVKLCDFGRAQCARDGAPLNRDVCIDRPLEVLFPTLPFTPAVDVWSLGCVAMELLLMSPVFSPVGLGCRQRATQAMELCQALGDPAPEELPVLQRLGLPGPRGYGKRPFLHRLPRDPLGELVQQVMRYTPALRVTPGHALAHRAMAGLWKGRAGLPPWWACPETLLQFGPAELERMAPEVHICIAARKGVGPV